MKYKYYLVRICTKTTGEGCSLLKIYCSLEIDLAGRGAGACLHDLHRSHPEARGQDSFYETITATPGSTWMTVSGAQMGL